MQDKTSKSSWKDWWTERKEVEIKWVAGEVREDWKKQQRVSLVDEFSNTRMAKYQFQGLLLLITIILPTFPIYIGCHYYSITGRKG